MANHKALIITPFFPPNRGGVETFCKELVTELSHWYNVEVVTIPWKKQKIWKGLPFFESLWIIPYLFFKSLGHKSDTIYAQGFNSAIVGAMLKKLWKCELTVTTHAIYNFDGILSWLARIILRQANTVFTEGKRCEDDLNHIGVWNTVRYMHWVDQDRFKPIERINEKLTVLFVGRPIEEKGIHIIRKVQSLAHHIDFNYATDVPAKDMPMYYQNTDILVVPSLYDESFARVVLEGASCGCVVIASNKGSLPELVSPFGIVIEPTVGNFYREICRLNHDRNMLLEMRNKAIKYAQQHFSKRNARVFL